MVPFLSVSKIRNVVVVCKAQEVRRSIPMQKLILLGSIFTIWDLRYSINFSLTNELSVSRHHQL